MFERIIHFSIQQRVLVVLLVVVAAALGLLNFQRLPIDAVPDITNNQVQINTEAPSLSLEEIEKQVTFPVEFSLSGIEGLAYTRSLSRNGFSQVTVVFEDGVDVYFARQQVAERLAEARESLPSGVEPVMGLISTGLGEVYMWTVEYVHSEGKDAPAAKGKPGWQPDGSFLTPGGERLRTPHERATYLRTLQDWVIRPQIKGVKGVAGVDAIGGYVKEYQVAPNLTALIANHLSFHDVVQALERNNLSTGAGYVEHQGEQYLIRADGRVKTLDDIRRIVLKVYDGVPVRVGDVAMVTIGRELRTGAAMKNTSEAVVGTALMLIGQNSRIVAAAVDEKMGQVNTALPPGIQASTVLNRTKLVDATIHTVEKNLLEGALLVIVVLFLLLGNLRAALLTAMAIPLSMLLAVTGMVQTGISGNLMSLGAVDFGLIVDGAVIIVENCLKRLAERQHDKVGLLTMSERLSVVRQATAEMVKPSVYGQSIIIIVYVPILALTGVEGKMFAPMAATVILALASAFVLSLTFVPAMVVLLIRGKVSEKENALMRAARRVYEPVLGFSLRWRWLVVGAAVAAFVASLGVFRTLGQEFAPKLDEKDLALHAMRIPSTSLTQSLDMQKKVQEMLGTFDEVLLTFSKIGTAEAATDPMPQNVADSFVIFKPREQWPNPSEPKAALIRRIETALQKLPGNNYEFTQPIEMRFNELISGIRSDVAVKVFGDDFPAMERSAAQIASILRDIPGAADVKVEQTQGQPTMTITPNHDAMARYGLPVEEVLDVVAIAVGGRQAGVVFEGDRRFPLLVRLSDAARDDVTTIGDLPIPLPQTSEAAGRRYVALRDVTHIQIAEGPNQVSRENSKRRVVVQANVRGSDLGTFVQEAQDRIQAGVTLPEGSWLDWGGQYENLARARSRLSWMVPACFVLIFMLLFTAFQSTRQALLVFTGVPLALTGGILALWLRNMPFSISAAVGFIALSGVAVLNGLVMITRINALREEGMPVADAVREGSLSRLRPVLMTALVASLGFIPMALNTGTGAEVQRPLATVVIGGLITATLLTLVILPALYQLFSPQKIPCNDLEGSK